MTENYPPPPAGFFTPVTTSPPASAPPNTPPPSASGYISLEQLEEILAARDKQHAEQLAAVTSRLPTLMVAANAGGPGSDNHQVSWSLAEQEAASRGEVLPSWNMKTA
jgi:hypothetical protein